MKKFKSGNTIFINIKKVLFLTIVFIMSYNSSFAQNCELERSKNDFGSENTVYSKDRTLASVFPLIGNKKPWDLVMNFMLINGSIYICATHQSQTYSSSLAIIVFKFKDGTVLVKGTPSSTGKYNTGFGYEYKFTHFTLNKEELELFASKDLLKFKTDFKYFPDYPVVEENIKSKNADKIRKDASCILSEVNISSDAKINNENDCKYEKNNIDDFTKKRTVQSMPAIVFANQTDDNIIFTNVQGCNIDGVRGLKINWGCNYAALKPFNQVDLLLENGEVINLKDTVASELLTDSNHYSIKLFTIDNDSIWEKLKTLPLSKIRISMNSVELGTVEIKKEYTKSFMKVINCVDILGIPKS